MAPRRRRYVVLACGAALVGGIVLMGGRMIWGQYKLAQRQEIMAAAPHTFEEGTQWASEADGETLNKVKLRLVSSHPAYALGVATVGLEAAYDSGKQARCRADNIVITAVMANCQLPTGSITAHGSYIQQFNNNPPGPTQFNAANIPLEPNGVPDLHPNGLPLSHFLGFTYSDTGPNYAKGADYILKLLTKRRLGEIPYNGIWTPANTTMIDARNCFASQARNFLFVMCFWEK